MTNATSPPNPLRRRASRTVTDRVHGDSFLLNGKKDAVDAPTAAVKHLPERDTSQLRFLLSNRMPFGVPAELGDGLLESRIPTRGCVRRLLGDHPSERLDGVGPRRERHNDAVTHRPCFSVRSCRISVSMSSTGTTFPARMSLMDAWSASMRSTRSASSISF